MSLQKEPDFPIFKKHYEKYRLSDMAIVALILDTGIKVSKLNVLNTEDYDRDFPCSMSRREK